MELFKLPHSTIVHRVVPKNAFDAYATNKQKSQFRELVSRITWLHKLSPETINLEARDIKEIQIFKVELKAMSEVQPVLDVIDKAIPYTIIFASEFGEEICLTTSIKHPHPVNEDNAVIDWTFKTNWFNQHDNPYELRLRKSLDAVYHDFCLQITKQESLRNLSMDGLVNYNRKKTELEKQIEQLRKSIKACTYYKQKVELNILLKQKIAKLKGLQSEY